MVHSKILRFCSFQCDSSCFKENKGQQSNGGMCIAQVAHTSMVPPGDENGHLQEHQLSGKQISPAPPKPTWCEPSTTQATLPPGLSLIRQTLIGHGLSTKAKDIIMASRRTGKSKQYDVYLKRWEQFCQSKGIDRLDASVANDIDFLATLLTSGLGYSAINTARSALSSVLILPNNITFGAHPLVARFLKGVFELTPSLPRYSSIWDVSVLIQHLRSLGPPTQLDLKSLTKKTTMLLCLLTGQQCQTLMKLDTALMQELPGKIVFTIGDKLKTTRPGKHLAPIELLAYPRDESIYVVSHLKQYIART